MNRSNNENFSSNLEALLLFLHESIAGGIALIFGHNEQRLW